MKMPYNRRRRCNAQLKQTKLITSRLMEISLKVDDYVYNNKTIAENDAEQFIQEVASYKPLCSNDDRCLQVIEKLTRIMKGIISEQQELIVGNICNENLTFEDYNQSHGSISPVYSIPDEDRTLFTSVVSERIEEAKDVVTGKRDQEIIDLCDSDDERLQQDIRQGIPSMVVDVVIHREISNLSLTPINQDEMTPANEECSQSILKYCESIEINEVQIKQIVKSVQVTPSGGECSQSILNNFENIDINKEQVTRNTENVSSIDLRTVVTNDHETNVVRTADPIKHTLQKNNVITVPVGAIPKPNNHLILTIDPLQNESNTSIDNTAMKATSTSNNKFNTLFTQNVTRINNNPSTAIAVKTVDYNHSNKIRGECKNTVTKNLQSKFSLNNHCKMNEYCSEQRDNTTGRDNIQTQFNADVSNKGSKNPRIKNKNTANTNKRYKPEESKFNAISYVNPAHIKVNQTKPVNNDDKSATTKKKSRKKKIQETSEKTDNISLKKPPIKRTVKHKNVKQSNKMIKIYNNNTDDDLSWVENIRFVREINDDEYDRHFKFAEDFWDNCSVPGICDDQDFNY